jgi:hypothetical protein
MVVWMALLLAAIVGMVALVTDGGRMFTERQHVQATADASALAAAQVLYQEYSTNQGFDTQGNARAAALQMAAANGITDGTNGVVTVNIPPLSGDFTGLAGYAEVIVSRPIDSTFSAIFHARQLSISGRATARGIQTGSPSVSGFYVLASTGRGAFHATGTTNLTVSGSLYVNSSDSLADQTDNGSSITATSFKFVGAGYNPTALNGPITQPAPPVADPLAALPPPAFSDYPMRSGSPSNISGTTTLLPGVYIGGITISSGNITLQPGLYLMDGGGFKVNNGTVNGTGVMIYSGADSRQIPGGISIAGGATVNLSPPTSGTYSGVTIFQDRQENNKLTIGASNNKNISGAIYAPAAEVDLSGPGKPGTPMDVMGGPVICLITQVQGVFTMTGGSGGGGTPQHLYGLVD